MSFQNILKHLQNALDEVNTSLEILNNEQSCIKKLNDKEAKETAIKTIKDLTREEQEIFLHPTLFMAKKVCPDI